MTNLPRLAATLQHSLDEVAERHARTSGFVQRLRNLSGATFVQTLVFGWLGRPDASLGHLAETAAALGCPIAPQSLDARFTESAAALLEAVLCRAMGALVCGAAVTEGLLARFAAVELLDTTVAALPAAVAAQWPGVGGNTPEAGRAALKVEVRFDLAAGGVTASLMPGRHHDQRGPLAAAPVRPGALQVADLGYFSLERFAGIDASGAYWLSRLKLGTIVTDASGTRLDALAAVREAAGTAAGLEIRLGAERALPCRLVARPVAPAVAAERRRRLRRSAQKHGRTPSEQRLALCGWTALVTNTPASKLSAAGAFALYRARWQVELLFKRWRSGCGVGQSRSEKPWRAVCEVYAKLLAGLVAHWVTAAGLWHRADRSAVKAWRVVAAHARHLAVSMGSKTGLRRALQVVLVVLAAGCRIDRRQQHPNTHQRLSAPEACALT